MPIVELQPSPQLPTAQRDLVLFAVGEQVIEECLHFGIETDCGGGGHEEQVVQVLAATVDTATAGMPISAAG